MTILNIVLSTIALLAIATATIFGLRKYQGNIAARKKAEQAKDEETHRNNMEKMLREHRDTTFTIPEMGGRIRGRIINWRVAWVNIVDPKTNRVLMSRDSVQHLFDTFECDPAEVRRLKNMERILNDIRLYREEEVKVVPKGYIVHKEVIHGQIVQYQIGDHAILDSNRVAITIAMRDDGSMYVKEVHLSEQLGVELTTTLDISTAAGQKHFEEQYQKNAHLARELYLEFARIGEVNDDIAKFNQHRSIFDYQANSARVLSYRPQPTEAYENPNARFQRLSYRS